MANVRAVSPQSASVTAIAASGFAYRVAVVETADALPISAPKRQTPIACRSVVYALFISDTYELILLN